MVDEARGRIAGSGPEPEQGWRIEYTDGSLSSIMPTRDAAENRANDLHFRPSGPWPKHIVGPDGQKYKLPWE